MQNKGKKKDNIKDKDQNNKTTNRKKTHNVNNSDTSSSESDVEVPIIESGDSNMDHDESEFCVQCGGNYYDTKEPKCDWL